MIFMAACIGFKYESCGSVYINHKTFRGGRTESCFILSQIFTFEGRNYTNSAGCSFQSSNCSHSNDQWVYIPSFHEPGWLVYCIYIYMKLAIGTANCHQILHISSCVIMHLEMIYCTVWSRYSRGFRRWCARKSEDKRKLGMNTPLKFCKHCLKSRDNITLILIFTCKLISVFYYYYLHYIGEFFQYLARDSINHDRARLY